MATETQMTAQKNELNQIAAKIEKQVQLAAAKTSERERQEETVENLKGGIINVVLNKRFEINQKLKWTNDQQKKIRFNELAAKDKTYQAAFAKLYEISETLEFAKAEAEFQRKLYRAAELFMLWSANQPGTPTATTIK